MPDPDGAALNSKASALQLVLWMGVFYASVGIVSGMLAKGMLANQAASAHAGVAWRWAAWVVSAVAFAAHIIYEQTRLKSSPTITALRVSLAAGLGAFGLAVAANIHAQAVAGNQHSVMLRLSLGIWPVITALPAFVVALIAAALLTRIRSHV